MIDTSRHPKPWGFGLFTRIVYVHQAICLVFFAEGLRSFSASGIDGLILPHLLGIALSVAVLIAMFALASRRSLKALTWLRLILWIGVVKILIVQFWLLDQGATQLTSFIHAMLINELIAIPLALYWSRPVHVSYLGSLKRSNDALAA